MESLKDTLGKKGFHCAHLNIRSLTNKHDLLSQTVEGLNNSLHVLGLSETWLTNQIPDNLIEIKGYVCERLDRGWGNPVTPTQVKRGGGVCLYINEHLNWSTKSYSLFNRNNNDIEIQWIEIINEKCKNFVIANGYRPPDGKTSEFFDYLEIVLENTNLQKCDLFLMGDFNIDYLDKKSQDTKKLKTILKQFGIDQLINKPTRYSLLRDSCLDLLCTNSDYIAKSLVCNINLSDHEMVLLTRKKVTIKQEKITFVGRSYKNYDKNIFTERLLAQSWENFETESDPEALWDTLIKNILNCIDPICPQKSFKVRCSEKPWFTNELLEQIKDKDRALKKAKKTGKGEHWKIARRLRNDCLREVRKAKSNFIQNELNINWNDSKKFWQHINTILPKNSDSSTIKLMDNDKPIHENDIPNFINNYFSNIGSKLAETMTEPWAYNGTRSDTELPNIITDEEEVSKLVKDIDKSKASAIENISSRIVKDAFEVIPHYLTILFNMSLSTGSVPVSWKKATVIPLKKEGNSPDVNNLRPISLLPIQIKLLEKIVHNRLITFLDQHMLLDGKQGGFRPNHSTIDTIVRFTEDIYKNLNEGQTTIAVYIDLRKAFDTVNHGILLKKMKLLGIKGRNYNWIENYLRDRSQCTVANNISSLTSPVKCGVPQGSVLGPLLFLIYVNDMKNILCHSHHYLYADDTVIYISGTNTIDVVNKLQDDLNNYNIWCKGNKLTVNTKKSDFVIYGTKSKVSKIHYLELKLNGENLSRVPFYKYLGVFLDTNLNFNKHVDVSKKLISHKLYLLSKIRKHINEYTATRIFQSMIAPLIDYGDVVYSGTSFKNLEKLQSLQNRGLRICINENVYFSTDILHQRCKIPKLENRRTYNLRKYMYRQKENMDLVIQREIRTRRHDAVIYETCKPNLEKYKKGAIYRGVIEWNNLAVDIRNIETFCEFKSMQRKLMMDKTLGV